MGFCINCGRTLAEGAHFVVIAALVGETNTKSIATENNMMGII